MADVKIKKLNDTWMSVKCAETHMEIEISERFSFEVEDAKFDPRVKRGQWDGVKRLYNRVHKRMYVGLLLELVKFLTKQGYTYEIDKALVAKDAVDMADIVAVTQNFIRPHMKGEPLEPYDYQYEAVHYMLNAGRSICLAATSAGKSMVLYLAIRMYQLSDDMDDKKIIVVVPSKMLVEQLYADFEEYSKFDGAKWHVSTFCQKISGKYSKFVNKQVVITTWQSLSGMPNEVIADAGAIFVDEVHTIKGPVLAGLLENAVNCGVRHGLTGTLDGLEANELAAQGLMGPAKRIVTAREIIDAGRATEVEIMVVVVDYDAATKLAYHKDQIVAKQLAKRTGDKGLPYRHEVEFINGLKSRFRYIQDLVLALRNNTIVLFSRKDGYGVPLYEDMKARHANTFLISGDVDDNEREAIRLSLENYVDAKVYATDKIMSTGVSIKNLHNMVFANSSKAKIKVIQSIGRLMRLHSSKDKALLIDIVDKLDYNGAANMTMKHVEERIKMYAAEKYKVRFVTVNLKEEQYDQ